MLCLRRLLLVPCLAIVAATPAVPSVPAFRVPCPSDGVWRTMVLQHRDRYPGWAIGDALKLVQQATTGSEHWVREGVAAAWMRREWAALGDGPREPLADTLGPGGRFVRVHLRPFRSAGGDPDVLVRAFVATAAATRPDTAALACAARALEAMVRRGELPWPADSMTAAVDAWSRAGYPALPHSEVFEERYRPAYRVVAAELLPDALAGTNAQPGPRAAPASH